MALSSSSSCAIWNLHEGNEIVWPVKILSLARNAVFQLGLLPGPKRRHVLTVGTKILAVNNNSLSPIDT